MTSSLSHWASCSVCSSPQVICSLKAQLRSHLVALRLAHYWFPLPCPHHGHGPGLCPSLGLQEPFPWPQVLVFCCWECHCWHCLHRFGPGPLPEGQAGCGVPYCHLRGLFQLSPLVRNFLLWTPLLSFDWWRVFSQDSTGRLFWLKPICLDLWICPSTQSLIFFIVFTGLVWALWGSELTWSHFIVLKYKSRRKGWVLSPLLNKKLVPR